MCSSFNRNMWPANCTTHSYSLGDIDLIHFSVVVFFVAVDKLSHFSVCICMNKISEFTRFNYTFFTLRKCFTLDDFPMASIYGIIQHIRNLDLYWIGWNTTMTNTKLEQKMTNEKRMYVLYWSWNSIISGMLLTSLAHWLCKTHHLNTVEKHSFQDKSKEYVFNREKKC